MSNLFILWIVLAAAFIAVVVFKTIAAVKTFVMKMSKLLRDADDIVDELQREVARLEEEREEMVGELREALERRDLFFNHLLEAQGEIDFLRRKCNQVVAELVVEQTMGTASRRDRPSLN